MSILLNCQSISKSFGSNNLFEGLSFSINEQDKVGVIGPNGVGKSTFLNILAKREEADEGQINYRKRLDLGFVAQNQDFPEDRSVLDYLLDAYEQKGIKRDEATSAAQAQLSQAGFEDLAKSVLALSGGWKKRLSILAGCVGDPDLVLFDEPTNHLDWEGIFWLEDYLKATKFSWLMITHDRQVLNRVASKILEINPLFPEFTFVTDGGYDKHLKAKADFIEAQLQYKDSLANKVRREEEWLKRGPKARTTKAKYRIDLASQLQNELSLVQSRFKERSTQIQFSASYRKTKQLLVFKEAQLSIGDKTLLSSFSYTLQSKQVIGLVGGNGSGKSSFFKMILGEIPHQGVVKKADQLKIVYFDQQRSRLDTSLSLKDALSENSDSVVFQGRSIHINSWANKFGFTYEQLETKLDRLSGGEQARVLIAQLMLEEADILLLDEPTNDLDIPTLEVLEQSLKEFPGAIILVTHDRYMLNRICGEYLALDGSGACSVYADLKQWQKDYFDLKKVSQKQQGKDTSQNNGKKTARKKDNKKLSYMEQREFDQIEDKILAAEDCLLQLQQEAQRPENVSNSIALQKIYSEIQEAQDKVDALYSRWTELEGKV